MTGKDGGPAEQEAAAEVAQDRPEPRTSEVIFADLRSLAQRDGALHEISSIIYRDWVVTIDTHDGSIADDPEHRWSTSKLNKNELMLLLGLTVQADTDKAFSVLAQDDSFAADADTLLRELHDRILTDCAPEFDKDTQSFIDDPGSIGLVAREAIYYGAESFYLHQFSNFSRQRYREDAVWFVQNAGLSIRPMLEIADFIIGRVNDQMTTVGHMRMEGHQFTNGDLTNSLLIAKTDVREKFGEKANRFFAKFAISSTGANADFTNPFAVNQANIAPIIDIGDCLYIPNQYRLLESIYESPFYWMMADKAYRDAAAQKRGEFLEKSSAHILTSVFGAANVFQNVSILDGAKAVVGEIDVLVVYGEFVLVVQAKSKRVTLKARAGDTEALKTDFKGAIQDPYEQALRCVELIKGGLQCQTAKGQTLKMPSHPRFFPVVILSDPFPASTFLSGKMLNQGDNIAPVIWDLGVLDCVAKMLPTPIEMLFYLKCRSNVFEKVISDSEYNFLGYHIRAKLALPPDADMMMLDRDFATAVDDYMIAADVGIDTERPKGVAETLDIPIISELLAELKNADPAIASVVIDLYDFSEQALTDISAHIDSLRKEIRFTGKAIKAFSVSTASGGITYAVTKELNANAAGAAEAIGSKHKYDTHSDRWYVIVDSVQTEGPIDGLLALVWPWLENEEDAKRSEEVALAFKSRREESKFGKAKRAAKATD
ncbi:nuclease-related domain-containing protein [Mesorhizobium sp. LjRoot246]|uniref:nuclease-related domain-containing protein n=1 Tax=Mesorhizobium sp. LjRoot246 TaxID=3342294 RepID=UPI003ED00F81